MADKNTWGRIETIGIALAITLSWAKNTSIFWAILHGLLGWFYIIYYAIWG